MQITKHIPSPDHGWYLCGYIPRHVNRGNGYHVPPVSVEPEDNVRVCKKCAAIQKREKITSSAIGGAGGDLLGAPDVEQASLQAQ